MKLSLKGESDHVNATAYRHRAGGRHGIVCINNHVYMLTQLKPPVNVESTD